MGTRTDYWIYDAIEDEMHVVGPEMYWLVQHLSNVHKTKFGHSRVVCLGVLHG